MRSKLIAPLLLAACAALAGCGGGSDIVELVPDEDPALIAALGEPITTDPDLASMNRADSAASLPAQDGSLPTVDNGPAIIAAARSDAFALVGGPGKMRKAPEPGEAAGSPPRPNGECAAQADYTFQWAARLPAPFPVYPRAAVQEAAGTDASVCALRAVNFITPVPLGEVMDFYFTRARAAGYSAERSLREDDDVLMGTKGPASYVLSARRLPSGNTEVDLLTDG